MKTPTIEKYRALYDEFMKLTCPGGVYRKPDAKTQDRIDECVMLIDFFDLHNPCYQIVCIKGCYVGQGIDYVPGNIVDWSYDPASAEARLKQMNADPWALDCFEIKIKPAVCGIL